MNNNILLEITQKIKEESAVFIIGFPRSGTTMLDRILLEHQSFKPYKYSEIAGKNFVKDIKYLSNPRNKMYFS